MVKLVFNDCVVFLSDSAFCVFVFLFDSSGLTDLQFSLLLFVVVVFFFFLLTGVWLKHPCPRKP